MSKVKTIRSAKQALKAEMADDPDNPVGRAMMRELEQGLERDADRGNATSIARAILGAAQ